MLAAEENFPGLARINRDLIARAEAVDSPRRVVLDMDSTEIPVYGQQENSAYNGHFESTCYHPLLLFHREGDCLAAKLRPGNVHSAAGWEELLLPEIERQQKQGKQVVFRAGPRGHPAFAKPEIYEALEERGVKYAIPLPTNDCLERDIAELLTRPVGRPSSKPVVRYKSFLYQAEPSGASPLLDHLGRQGELPNALDHCLLDGRRRYCPGGAVAVIGSSFPARAQGKTAPLGHQEPIRRDAQCCVMVKPAPRAAFEMPQPPSSCFNSKESLSTIQRCLASRNRSFSGVSGSRFDSQYFVGSAAPFGHSSTSHSSSCGSARQ